MSFIGADGQDHLIRSLKAQVQSKGAIAIWAPTNLHCGLSRARLICVDGELASVRNELAKCKQSLDEEKKARQGLEYQVCVYFAALN